MKNKMQIFEDDEFGKVRVQTEGDKIFFCLKDICDKLELTNPSKVKQQIEDEFGCDLTNSYVILDALNREQKATFITEEQLYFCIFKSRKQEAKKFRSWIFNEVIPSIRKNGGYIMGQEEMSPELIMAKAILVANNVIEEQKRQLELKQKEIKEKDELNEFLNDVIITNKPKVDSYDDLMNTEDTLNIRDFIRHTKHVHNQKEKDIIDYLCRKKIIFRDKKGKLQGYSNYINKGYIKIVQDTYKVNGINKFDYRAVITLKGVDKLLKMIKKDFYI